jgi:hypothetical protein
VHHGKIQDIVQSMSMLQTEVKPRFDADRIGRLQLIEPLIGFGHDSRRMSQRLEQLQRPSPIFEGSSDPGKSAAKSLNEQLYDALASFKTRTALVAMHLDRDRRDRLFKQLDNLLDFENWENDDLPPKLASFETFLRLLMLVRPDKRPGLGATYDGKLLAAWTSGSDRLTIECWPGDSVRWNLTVMIDGEVERAAAVTPLPRLAEVLRPYRPERWFNNANSNPR